MSNQQRAHTRESTVSRTNTKRAKRKLKALDKYVLFSISVILIFTIAQMIITAITGVTQDTLITAFFACFGGELLITAITKWLKLKTEDKGTNNDNTSAFG